MILYDGEFDAMHPQSGALALNDDSDGIGAGGVVMATCGATAQLCPKISANLTGGKFTASSQLHICQLRLYQME